MVYLNHIIFGVFGFITQISADNEHTLHILQLHRNNVLNRYESHTHALEHIQHHFNELLDETSPTHFQQNNFILTINDVNSFPQIRDVIGEHKIETFHGNHILISATPSVVKTILADFKEVVNAIPIIPNMKLSEEIESIPSQCTEDSQVQKFLIEFAPLPLSEQIPFLIWLEGYSKTLESPLIYSETDFIDGKRSLVKISTKCKHFLEIANILANQREILWIEHFNDFSINNYWIRGVLESGNYANAPIARVANLTGQNQIIGISDTGLDLYSTYFYDSKVNLASDVQSSSHRKVVKYITVTDAVYGDFTDINEGHGTHGKHYICICSKHYIV